MNKHLRTNGVQLNIELREPIATNLQHTSDASLKPTIGTTPRVGAGAAVMRGVDPRGRPRPLTHHDDIQFPRVGVDPCGRPRPPINAGQLSTTPTTLVLLHGFTGSAASWGNHLDTFASWGIRAIAIDMLGHGQSDAPANPQRYSIEHCQQDILATLQELGVNKGEAFLLGYSMGGRIALYTALSGFFRALILESASPGLDGPTEREQRRASDEALAASIERDGIAAFVAHWEQLPLFASQHAMPPEHRAALHEQRLQNRPTGLANSLRGIGTGTQPALHSQLPTLTIPVLLMAGELDKKYTAIARQMTQSLPHAQLRIVPGAGHTIHLEQSEVFTSLIRSFIEQEAQQSTPA